LGLQARQFHFTRSSFGLSAAPGIFLTATDRLILPAKEKNPNNDLVNLVSAYLDDVCIAGFRISRNAPKITSTLQSAKSSRVSPKGQEMRAIQGQVVYLGHELCKDGLKMEKSKVNRILHWPEPNSVKELKSWLGFVGFYQNFIPNFAKLCSPFDDLLRKNRPYQWTEECRISFKKLQKAVSTQPVLGIPKLDGGKFILTIDASFNGLEASLAQLQENKEVTITFWSKTLNAAQRNYCITNLPRVIGSSRSC